MLFLPESQWHSQQHRGVSCSPWFHELPLLFLCGTLPSESKALIDVTGSQNKDGHTVIMKNNSAEQPRLLATSHLKVRYVDLAVVLEVRGLGSEVPVIRELQIIDETLVPHPRLAPQSRNARELGRTAQARKTPQRRKGVRM